MSEKTTGYTLLIVGILIMVFAAIQIVLVFTNKAKPISFFTISSNQTDIDSLRKSLQSSDSGGLSGQNVIPKIDIVPPDVLNNALNLTIYFFLMSFVLNFGYEIANLGAMLIRPVYVKMKVKEESVSPVKPQ